MGKGDNRAVEKKSNNYWEHNLCQKKVFVIRVVVPVIGSLEFELRKSNIIWFLMLLKPSVVLIDWKSLFYHIFWYLSQTFRLCHHFFRHIFTTNKLVFFNTWDKQINIKLIIIAYFSHLFENFIFITNRLQITMTAIKLNSLNNLMSYIYWRIEWLQNNRSFFTALNFIQIQSQSIFFIRNIAFHLTYNL